MDSTSSASSKVRSYLVDALSYHAVSSEGNFPVPPQPSDGEYSIRPPLEENCGELGVERLKDLLMLRSSERTRRRTITPQLVETTLRVAQGLPTVDGRRAYPSPGGTYSVSLAWIGFGTGAAMGIATLRPDGSITWTERGTAPDLGEQLLRVSAYPAATSQGAFMLTGDLGIVGARYGERGYRYMLLEAGHIAQNLILALALQGISSCPIGAFDDQVATDLLGDYVESLSLPIYAIALP